MIINMKQVIFLGGIPLDIVYVVKLGTLTWKNHYCSTSCDGKITAYNMNAFFFVKNQVKEKCASPFAGLDCSFLACFLFGI